MHFVNPSKGQRMTIDMRPYAEPADLQRLLDLKRICTIPENMYDLAN